MQEFHVALNIVHDIMTIGEYKLFASSSMQTVIKMSRLTGGITTGTMTTSELSEKDLKKLLLKKEKRRLEEESSKSQDTGASKMFEKKKSKSDKGKGEETEAKPEKRSKKSEASAEDEVTDLAAAAAGRNTVRVTGYDGLKPATDFKEPKFIPALHKLFEGFSNPTPIQSYCWPAIQTGRDVIGIAETGAGKTLGFSLPALSAILSAGPQGKIRMVVVAPTRELALQTHSVLCKAVSSVCIYGGMSKDDQRKELRTLKPVVVVGTPGRVVDFLNDETLQFGGVSHFVLDEADRMLDMGFADDIGKIVAKLAKDHQTVMFSATWPPSIQSMAAKYLRANPVKIVIGDREGGDNTACTTITQLVQVVRNPMDRESLLLSLLKKYHADRKNRVLIFVLYKKEADRLEHFLQRNGWRASSIHGDKPQMERTRCMDNFRNGTEPLLVATDVAARGLDIPNVDFVINYTFPLTIEDYIHRIGRTGRGGKTGLAHTLFTDNDKAHAGELVNVLKKAGVEPPKEMYNYDCTTKKKVHKLYGAFYKEADPTAEVSHITFSDNE